MKKDNLIDLVREKSEAKQTATPAPLQSEAELLAHAVGTFKVEFQAAAKRFSSVQVSSLHALKSPKSVLTLEEESSRDKATVTLLGANQKEDQN